MKAEEIVKGWADEFLAPKALFTVSVRMLPKGRLVILMDGDEGVTIDQCAELSRYLGQKIEEENLIEHQYNLEVSSPGVDYPLVLQRQYPKHIGRTLSILLPSNNRVQGTLTEVLPELIRLEVQQKEKGKKAVLINQDIAFADIKEAKITISFN